MKNKLEADCKLLEKQRFWLFYSLQKCDTIGMKKEFSPEEFGEFETLCARYARGIDFLIRKFYRTLDLYEFENQGTLIDVVNRAHKRGLIDDIEELRMMKDLRNDIVHEYIEEELPALFDDVLTNSHRLLHYFNRALEYAQQRLL